MLSALLHKKDGWSDEMMHTNTVWCTLIDHLGPGALFVLNMVDKTTIDRDDIRCAYKYAMYPTLKTCKELAPIDVYLDLVDSLGLCSASEQFTDFVLGLNVFSQKPLTAKMIRVGTVKYSSLCFEPYKTAYTLFVARVLSSTICENNTRAFLRFYNDVFDIAHTPESVHLSSSLVHAVCTNYENTTMWTYFFTYCATRREIVVGKYLWWKALCDVMKQRTPTADRWILALYAHLRNTLFTPSYYFDHNTITRDKGYALSGMSYPELYLYACSCFNVRIAQEIETNIFRTYTLSLEVHLSWGTLFNNNNEWNHLAFHEKDSWQWTPQTLEFAQYFAEKYGTDMTRDILESLYVKCIQSTEKKMCDSLALEAEFCGKVLDWIENNARCIDFSQTDAEELIIGTILEECAYMDTPSPMRSRQIYIATYWINRYEREHQARRRHQPFPYRELAYSIQDDTMHDSLMSTLPRDAAQRLRRARAWLSQVTTAFNATDGAFDDDTEYNFEVLQKFASTAGITDQDDDI